MKLSLVIPTYNDKKIYVLFGDYVTKPDEEYKQIKEDLENNLQKVFECEKERAFTYVYKY